MSRVLHKPFHEAFLDCYTPHTDIPVNFLNWGALSLIGAALKDNVSFNSGTYTIYPNIFVILVSPPGIGKSAIQHIVKDLIEATEPNPLVNLVEYRNTTESILMDIEQGWAKAPAIHNQQIVIGATDHSCLCLSTEIRTLLGASEWMLIFLEEAWSETSFGNKTKNKGIVKIKEMCFSLLAASVPSFMRDVDKMRNSKMIITGGFTSRCFFTYADAPSKFVPFLEPMKDNPKSKSMYDNLVIDLREIGTLRGKFAVDTSARILFEQFLKQQQLIAKSEYSEVLQNSRARIKANTLKLAMIFSASRGNDLIINQVDMANAIAEVGKMFGQLSKLFRGAGEGMDTATSAKVQDFIEKCGRTTEKEIYKALHEHINSPETLNRILFVLETIGFCAKTNQGGSIYYVHTPAAMPKNGRVGP